MVNLVTKNADGSLNYEPYSTSAMSRVILSGEDYDLDNRGSFVDFLIKDLRPDA
jgi:hypothetical protein